MIHPQVTLGWGVALMLLVARGPCVAQSESKNVEERLERMEDALLKIQKSQKELIDLASFRSGEERVKVGEVAPDFNFTTLKGQDFRLSDFRGKYVLLDFWAVWCQPSKEETLLLKSVQQKFSGRTNLVFVGLSLDDHSEKPADFLKTAGIERAEGFLGNWNKDILRNGPTRLYGVKAIPSIWLIGPDGKVLGKNLRGAAVEKAIEQAMAASLNP